MQKYLALCKQTALFRGMSLSDIEAVLKCLEVQVKSYRKEETIFFKGETISSFGIVLSGAVQVLNYDENGNRVIIVDLLPAQIFAESLSSINIEKIPITVVASENSEILFLSIKRILHNCSAACVFHTQLMENLLYVLAQKNIALHARVALLSQRSIRERLIYYLSEEARKAGGSHCVISFTREELADFLCVDRSAMSRELSRMRKEGVVEFHKREFHLL